MLAIDIHLAMRRCVLYVTRDQPHPYLDAFRVEAFREGAAIRVVPVGELDVTTCGEVQTLLSELRGTAEGVVLDLRRVTFLESTAVRMILAEQQVARTDGSEFSIINGVPLVDRVFDLCGVHDHLQFTSA